MMRNKYAEAITDCSVAISLQPRNWRLRQLRVDIYGETRRYDQAAAEYSDFIAQRPGDGGLLLGRAKMFRLAGEYDRAIADAQAAHRLYREWSRPYLESGLIYLAKNDLPNALDSYDSLVSVARHEALPRLLKGQVQWAMGRFGDAAESFEDSLDQDAQQPYALLWLDLSASRAGKKPSPSALKPFLSAELSAWPGPLVSVYVGKTQPTDVLKLKGQDPVTGDDFQCATDFYVGEWYRMQGDTAEAKRLLQETAKTCAVDWWTRQLAAIDLGRPP